MHEAVDLGDKFMIARLLEYGATPLVWTTFLLDKKDAREGWGYNWQSDFLLNTLVPDKCLDLLFLSISPGERCVGSDGHG